jgi:hypothetical protein
MSARDVVRACGCLTGVVVLLVVGSVIRQGVSDSRQARAYRREADQRSETMTAFFAHQVDILAQHSTPSAADLSRAAQQTRNGAENTQAATGVLALGFQVLEPVTRGTQLSFVVKVLTVYREPGLFMYGSSEGEHCFRLDVPVHGDASAKTTTTRLPTCPTSEPLQPSPTPSGAAATRGGGSERGR